MTRFVLAVTLLAFLMLVPAAHAATVSVDSSGGSPVINYVAAAGETNQLSVSYGNNSAGLSGEYYMFFDQVPITAGSGCSGTSSPTVAECEVPGASDLVVRLDDQNDSFGGGTPIPAQTVVDGGPGDDTLSYNGPSRIIFFGGTGNDQLYSTSSPSGVELHGGLGNDYLTGANGDDRILGERGGDFVSAYGGADSIDVYDGAKAAENDVVHCGEGQDPAVVGDTGDDGDHVEPDCEGGLVAGSSGGTGGGGADTTAPVVTVTRPSDRQDLSDGTPLFMGRGEIGGSAIVITLHVWNGREWKKMDKTLQAAVDGAGRWQVVLDGTLADGTYFARAYQADAAGNLGFSTGTQFTITRRPPPVSSCLGQSVNTLDQTVRTTAAKELAQSGFPISYQATGGGSSSSAATGVASAAAIPGRLLVKLSIAKGTAPAKVVATGATKIKRRGLKIFTAKVRRSTKKLIKPNRRNKLIVVLTYTPRSGKAVVTERVITRRGVSRAAASACSGTQPATGPSTSGGTDGGGSGAENPGPGGVIRQDDGSYCQVPQARVSFRGFTVVGQASQEVAPCSEFPGKCPASYERKGWYTIYAGLDMFGRPTGYACALPK